MLHRVKANGHTYRFDLTKVVCVVTRLENPDGSVSVDVYIAGMPEPLKFPLTKTEFESLVGTWDNVCGS